MYKSPIEIIMEDALFRFETELADHTVNAVSKYGIHVDKDELIRALQYDRDQYNKGFMDGLNARREWISVAVRLPENEDYVLAATRTRVGKQNVVRGYYVPETKNWVVGMNSNVTHWMPIPELPEEDV